MNESRISSAAKGVVATTVTPFHEDGSVDLPALRRNVDFVVEGGSDMIVPCGNTGEHASLVPDEIRTIARETVGVIDGRAVVVVGIGGPIEIVSTLEAEMGMIGADGVMVHEPAHVHTSPNGVRRYSEAICDAAPDLAVFPYKRNSRVLPDDVLEGVLSRSNLLGVKYASPDVRALRDLMKRAREAHPNVAWINGLAETWAPPFAASGAIGFTSGLVNVAPHLSASIRDALHAAEDGEMERLWELVKPFEYLRAENGAAYNVPVVKEAAAQLGLMGRTVRTPLTEIEPVDARRVGAILERWGLA